MTEANATPTEPSVQPARRLGRRAKVLILVVLLGVLGAAGYGAWRAMAGPKRVEVMALLGPLFAPGNEVPYVIRKHCEKKNLVNTISSVGSRWSTAAQFSEAARKRRGILFCVARWDVTEVGTRQNGRWPVRVEVAFEVLVYEKQEVVQVWWTEWVGKDAWGKWAVDGR